LWIEARSGLAATVRDGTEQSKVEQLQSRLRAAAESRGMLDVSYRTVDSPIGPLLLAASAAGLIRVAFASQGEAAILEAIADAVSPRILKGGGRLDGAARQLEEYFERRRQEFDVVLDLRLAHGFRRDILTALQSIAYGSTASYAGIAAAAGHPRAVRAAGTACALNPLPIVIPCHRVVRSDGTPGNYAGGPEAKLRLLALEGVL
jgi:methylated-DNA-[protein]-cysteine S-methyltransferase